MPKEEEDESQDERSLDCGQTWCPTKQEIQEHAANILLEADKDECSMLLQQTRTLQDSNTTNRDHKQQQQQQQEKDTSIPQGDVRAYFTRHLSKVLAQSSVLDKPLSKATTTLFIPGSNVSSVQENPPLLENAWSNPISLEDVPLRTKRSKSRPPARFVAKTLRPGARVLETEEADTKANMSLTSKNHNTRNKRHKKRRLTFDKTISADDNQEVMTVADSIPKRGSPVCESDDPSPVETCLAETTSTSREQAASPTLTEKPPSSTVDKNQACIQARQDAPTKPPICHVLLGNIDMPCEATMNDCSDRIPGVQIPHPRHCSDTQTDGVLSCVETEYAWLCEESLHCLQSEHVAWSFVYKHASRALQMHLRRHGTHLIRMDLADAMNAKRKSVRALLMQGYRRPHMKKTIALYRLAIRQGRSVEQVLQISAATKKQATLKSAPTKLVAKNKSAMPPHVSNVPSKGHVNERALEKVGVSKILTKNESEVAWLLEESILQNAFDGIDYQYVLEHASPVLRLEIERHKRRWLPRVVRLNCSSVKREFEEERDRIYQLLWSGYRRPETKAALPAGRVTSSEYKKQQSS
jgi:hypothetical protein